MVAVALSTMSMVMMQPLPASEGVPWHGRLVRVACRRCWFLSGKCSFGHLLHLSSGRFGCCGGGFPDSSMVGDGGGGSQPVHTTVAGGVHMVVSVLGYPRAVAGELNRACRVDHLHDLSADRAVAGSGEVWE
jgi:hypothetical protein